MADGIGSRISVRLDADTAKKLQIMVEQTGHTKSEVIVSLINQDYQVPIIDGKKIAAELQELRLLIKKGNCTREQTYQVSAVCNLITEEIYKLFTSGGA